MNDITKPPASLAAIAQKPLRQVANVRELLVNDQARDQLSRVAAKHMNPERMMRVMANAIRTTPKLAECEPMSLLGALMNCAALGVEPNTPLGHAYLIPFKNNRKGITEVQMILGYKGMADMARRSGQVRGLHADVVYSDDELWDYEYGSDMRLRHKPGPRRGKKIAAYCHVTLEDGQAFVVLPWDEIMRIRDASQNWKSALKYGKTADNPWSTHEDRMAAKSAVRALANRGEMPLSIEFMEAMEQEDHTVDYRAFAQNPEAGLTIEGEAEQPDGDGAEEPEDTGPAMIEETPPPQTLPKEQPKERSPARSSQREAPPKEEPKGDLLDRAAPTERRTGPDAKEMAALQRDYDRVLSDAMDGGRAAAIEANRPLIDNMEARAPEMHAALMGELQAFVRKE
jgi:recombination protein RecT